MEGQTVGEKSQGVGRPRYSYSQRVCFGIVSGEYSGKSQPSLFPKKERGDLRERGKCGKKMLVKKEDKKRLLEKKGLLLTRESSGEE